MADVIMPSILNGVTTGVTTGVKKALSSVQWYSFTTDMYLEY